MRQVHYLVIFILFINLNVPLHSVTLADMPDAIVCEIAMKLIDVESSNLRSGIYDLSFIEDTLCHCDKSECRHNCSPLRYRLIFDSSEQPKRVWILKEACKELKQIRDIKALMLTNNHHVQVLAQLLEQKYFADYFVNVMYKKFFDLAHSNVALSKPFTKMPADEFKIYLAARTYSKGGEKWIVHYVKTHAQSLKEQTALIDEALKRKSFYSTTYDTYKYYFKDKPIAAFIHHIKKFKLI